MTNKHRREGDIMKDHLAVLKAHIHKATDSMQAALSYAEMSNYVESLVQVQNAIKELNKSTVRLASIIADYKEIS